MMKTYSVHVVNRVSAQQSDKWKIEIRKDDALTIQNVVGEFQLPFYQRAVDWGLAPVGQ